MRGLQRLARGSGFTQGTGNLYRRTDGAEAAKYGMQIQVAEKASIESMVEKIVKQFGRK